MSAKNSLNIVFTGSFQFPLGMAGSKRVKNLMREQSSSVKVLLVTNSSKNNRKGTYNGIPYYTVLRSKSSLLNIFLFVPYFIIGLFKLKKFYVREAIRNILYVYDGISIDTVLFIKAARRMGYKVVVDIVEDYRFSNENVSQWRAIKNKSKIKIENSIHKYVNGIIVISKYLEAKFTQNRNFSLPVLYLPISAENLYFRTGIKPDFININRFNLLYSGTYGVKEGLQYIIEALDTLVKSNDKIMLILTGNPSSDIKRQIEIKNLGNYVTYTGFISDENYYNLIAHCNVLLMNRVNSKYANASFPFKLGEYLASRVPVIATNVSDISLILEDQVNAYIIEPENTTELVKAIENIILDIPKSIEIGRMGYKIARLHFDAKSHFKKLKAFLLTKLVD